MICHGDYGHANVDYRSMGPWSALSSHWTTTADPIGIYRNTGGVSLSFFVLPVYELAVMVIITAPV